MSLLKPRENVGIFVSYRRADTAGHAGRLVDHLKNQFGQQVFFDVDSISPGANFHKVIEETFAKCGAVVILIGKSWLERDASMPPFGDSRDVITQEIRFAMESNLPIVPVLVDGATMPSESRLPSQFAALSTLNAIDLRHTSFDRDLQAVREQLGEILGAARATKIEKGFLKIFGPFFGSSFARISGGIVGFSVFGALWALVELAAAGIVISQQGLRGLFTPSLMDPEMLRLQAVWTAALGALLFRFPRAQIDPLVAPCDRRYVRLLSGNHRCGFTRVRLRSSSPRSKNHGSFRQQKNRCLAVTLDMQMIPHDIKVLAFDVFGTVVDWRSSVIAEGEQLGKAKGLQIDWPAFADAWRSIYRPYMDRVGAGKLPWTKLDDLHRQMLEETLLRFGIQIP